MLLFFLPFLFFSSSFSTFPLIEHWECGADKHGWSKDLAQFLTQFYDSYMREHINLCCKVHDNCYDHHDRTGVSQDLCDTQFCICLQDTHDKEKYGASRWLLNQGCAMVQTSRDIFHDATPPNHSKDYIDFPDYKPMFMNFRSILASCPYNQRIIVHCHNTVHKCLLGDHEQEDGEKEYGRRRFGDISEPYQDCRATMYDCLRSVLATSHSEQCTSTVLREREKINIYEKITSDGDSINIAYPIVASRMLTKCPKLSKDLHICYKDFFHCDVGTKRIRDERYDYELRRACGFNNKYCKNPPDITEHPEYNFYDEVKRIDITCHRGLSGCFHNIESGKGSTIAETDMCKQAFGMAVKRIREDEYKPVTPYLE